jgi:hypothetical protein
VKYLAFILTIHILSANMGSLAEPFGLHLEWLCCDDSESEEEDSTEDTSVCNPFVLCHCCFVFFPDVMSLLFAETPTLSAYQLFYFLPKPEPSAALFWHPPRM